MFDVIPCYLFMFRHISTLRHCQILHILMHNFVKKVEFWSMLSSKKSLFWSREMKQYSNLIKWDLSRNAKGKSNWSWGTKLSLKEKQNTALPVLVCQQSDASEKHLVRSAVRCAECRVCFWLAICGAVPETRCPTLFSNIFGNLRL